MTKRAARLEAVEGLVEELKGPASSFEKLEAILTCPITYALADALPDKPTAGRPRDFPKYMWIVYHALVTYVWGSARGVDAELSHEHTWRFIRRTVKRLFPDAPEMWLPKRPMRRWHYAHALSYLRDADVLEQLKAVSRQEAANLAKGFGMFDEDAPTSWTHPDPDRFLQADGKVIKPLYKAKAGQRLVDQETGEVRDVRFDPDAHLHVVGGGDKMFGTKFAVVSARNEHLRVVLDTEYVPHRGDGGEAGAAMRCFHRLAPLLPGAQGVNYDMAMRGAHIDEAMRELGWLIVTKVHDTKDRLGNRQEWHIEDQEVEDLNGHVHTLSIYARDGAPGLRVLTDTGEFVFVPLERVKTERRGAPGRYRFYGEYELPDEHGDKPLRLRLHGNEQDDERGLNRAEHLRAIPPSDPDFKTLNRRRNDAESINRGLQDTLYLGRAHSVGHVAQEADLLGFGLGLNALSWHRHRKAQGLPAVA